MRLLVTGGAGFIGANLVSMASNDPAFTDIRVIDDLSTGLIANLRGLDIEVVKASVNDERQLARAMAGRDAVVHLAALPSVPRSIHDPLASHHANATGTLLVLDSARRRGVQHVVVASSSSVYGANTALPMAESTWTRPLSPYAASKLAAESYALAYQFCYGLPTLAFRFFNVYGPAQRHDHPYAAVIPRFIHAVLNNEPVIFHGDGRQSRDFTQVRTVCAVLIDAVRRKMRHPEPVNLAFGVRTTLRSVVDELERLVGRPVTRHHGVPRPGDIPHSVGDGRLVRTLFPRVAPVPLEEGLRETLQWFQEHVPSSGRLSGSPLINSESSPARR